MSNVWLVWAWLLSLGSRLDWLKFGKDLLRELFVIVEFIDDSSLRVDVGVGVPVELEQLELFVSCRENKGRSLFEFVIWPLLVWAKGDSNTREVFRLLPREKLKLPWGVEGDEIKLWCKVLVVVGFRLVFKESCWNLLT